MATDARRVILLSVDNLRADCVGANPDKSAMASFKLDHLPATPTLDWLADQGTIFTQCFSASPYTTASHASILTGVLPVRHGIREYYRHAIVDSVPTLFQRFKDSGYLTVMATDFPFLLGSNLGFTRAVDHYIVEDDSKVLSLLQQLRTDKVFAFVHFGSVHNPFGLTSLQVDGEHFIRQVNTLGDKMNVPEQTQLHQEWIERPRITPERLLRQRYFKCTDLLYQQKRYDELMGLYVEGVEYFDSHRFRSVVRELRSAGLLEDAAIALVADHGEEYSERAFAHYNGLWEGIITVPLILIGPGVPAGRLSRELCRTVDIAPTLLQLAGAENTSAQGFDGKSLCRHLNSGETLNLVAQGESWFGHTDHILDFMSLCQSAGRLLKARSMANTHLEYVRTPQWKLISRTDLDLDRGQMALFKIDRDRCERHDLAVKLPEVVAAMSVQLIGHREPEGKWIDLEEDEIAQLALNLKDLGYLKGSATPQLEENIDVSSRQENPPPTPV